MSSNKYLEKKASEFRQQNGMSDRDCIRIKSLLNKLNVLTIFKPLSNEFAGMTIKIEENPSQINRFILVNSNHALGRQHFTICHELYHLYIQEKFTYQICNPCVFDKKDIEEYNADIFAAYLLIPRDGILMLINNLDELDKNRISLSTIIKLEQYFSCSRVALLYRLMEMQLISSDYGEQFKKDVKRGALSYGFSTDLYENGNHHHFVGDYGIIARKLFEKDTISESYYHTLLLDLGIKIEELEQSNE